MLRRARAIGLLMTALAFPLTPAFAQQAPVAQASPYTAQPAPGGSAFAPAPSVAPGQPGVPDSGTAPAPPARTYEPPPAQTYEPPQATPDTGAAPPARTYDPYAVPPTPGTQPSPPQPAPSFETHPSPPLTPGPGTPPGTVPPPAPNFETRPAPPLTPGTQGQPGFGAPPPPLPPPRPDTSNWLDGHPRSGPFLSGPGSLTFVLHHSIMGGLGAFATQAFPNHFDLAEGSREAMLAGLIIGASAGFSASAWWQFNHWIDRPMANLGIANSIIGGMFATGLMDLVSNDTSLLTWTAFIGSELAAWLTAGLAGGEIAPGPALAIGSGAVWALAYTGLLLAILSTSGTHLDASSTVDTLLIAPGLGAGFVALSMLHFHPTPTQVLRGNLFGAAVGAAVLVLSGVVLGRFDVATPYVLSLLGSAAAIGAVSLLWEEKAEKPHVFNAQPRREQAVSVWW